jgi:hypothetical protein
MWLWRPARLTRAVSPRPALAESALSGDLRLALFLANEQSTTPSRAGNNGDVLSRFEENRALHRGAITTNDSSGVCKRVHGELRHLFSA